MADIIAKLVLQSGEFDSKIKRAVTGLQQMENECRNVGGTLAILEKDQKEYVQSLGRMQTVSTSVRGKISELSNAYVELRSQYNRLTQEEKNGDFGKALSASLDQLKTRINDSKKELNDINAELGNTRKEGSTTSSILDDLAGKFGMNVGQLLKFSTAAGAVTAALKVGKDAFFENESTLDEWGRTVQASQSLYSSFLTALNNGDISGFLSNMSQIVSAAKEAYNAMDELNTNNAFAQRQDAQNRAGYQEALEQYKLKPTKENKAKLDQANKAVVINLQKQYKETENAYIKGLRSIGTNQGLKGKDLQNFVNLFSKSTDRYALQKAKQGYSTGRGLNAGAQYWNGNRVYDGRIQVNGKWRDMTAQESQRFNYARALTQVNDTKIQEIQGFGAQSVALREQIAQQNRQYNRLAGNNGKPTTPPPAPTTTKIPKPKTTTTPAAELTEEQKIQKQINELVQEGMGMDEKARTAQREKIAALQTQLEGYKKIKDELLGIEKKEKEVKPEKPTYTQAFSQGAVSLPSIQAYVSGLQSELANTDIGSDMFNTLTEKMSDAGRMSEVLKAAMESGVQGVDLTSVAQEMKAKLLEGDITDEQWQEFLDKINEKIDNSDLKLKIDVDTKGIVTGADEQKKLAAQTQKAWNMAAQSVDNLSTALNSIEDPAAKAAGTVIKAIADIALGFAQASVQAGEMGPWGWVAWLAAGTAALATTISTVHSLTGFANGGIVPGNSLSGDNVYGGGAMVNSGELVLNKAQQGNLASILTDSAVQGFGGQPYVEGEKIFLGMNNSSRRMGRGEIVTTQTLRRMGLTR